MVVKKLDSDGLSIMDFHEHSRLFQGAFMAQKKNRQSTVKARGDTPWDVRETFSTLS